jgi:putative ABC transport system permease protein
VTAASFLRQLARESRGARGRLAFFALCLAAGVAGVVAVAGFSASLRSALASEARRLLAGDLRVEALRPLPAEGEALLAAEPGIAIARVQELPTVVAAPPGTPGAGRSRLVELRAVEGGFPFYGEIGLEPARPLAELVAGDGAVAAPELLAGLDLSVGDPVSVGGRLFTLRGVVRSEPDRLGSAFALGPRLYVSGEGLRATGLLALGSRIEHRLLVALPPGAGAAAAEDLERRLRAALPDPTPYRFATAAKGQPELERNVDRTERFLGLAALLSLVVGGVGVAQTVRAWLAARLDAIAVWKTLGASPREIALLHVAQVALLALGGSAAGAVAGLAVQRLVPRLLATLVPDLPLPAFQPGALARGLALGVGVALLFALPPLAAALRVPAARVLRRDAEPLPWPRPAALGLGLALVAGTAAIAALQARSLLDGALFAAGLTVAAGLLAAVARALVVAARRLPRLRLPVALRWGVAALARPGAGTLAHVVALGLGALVLTAMATVERGLVERLRSELPTDAPTAFLIDIQPSQWQAVRGAIEAAGATRIDSVPVVMARLAAIDGVAVRELAEQAAAARQEGRKRWALTREQRLTWLEQLAPDNEIVAGSLWSDPGRYEVSVEEEFARDLGLRVGSTIRFDVQGVPVELAVTSLRRVRWETFGINFFLVAEPGALDRAPQMRIAAVRLPAGGEDRLRDALAAAQPNVTLFAIRDVLEKVAAVLSRIGFGIRFLGGFTVVAGAAILAGAVAAGAARRAREVAVGKAIGMTRLQAASLFAAEYGLSGAAGGLVGAIAGTALAAVVLERGLEVPWRLDFAVPLAIAAATALLAVAAGLAASVRPLAERPIEALRHE